MKKSLQRRACPELTEGHPEFISGSAFDSGGLGGGFSFELCFKLPLPLFSFEIIMKLN